MRTETYKCGKASITYEPQGEDSWIAESKNTNIVCNDNFGVDCVCKDCGDNYDGFDPCMVDVIEQ